MSYLLYFFIPFLYYAFLIRVIFIYHSNAVYAHCFPVRVILLWDRLPASIVLAGNIQLFKKLLRQVDFSYAMLGKD